MEGALLDLPATNWTGMNQDGESTLSDLQTAGVSPPSGPSADGMMYSQTDLSSVTA